MDEEENMMQNQEDTNRETEKNRKKEEMGKKVAEKAAKKLAGKGSLMAPLAHIVMIAAPILIAIILIVGIIIFLLTMPGMVMDKLKGMFEALGNYVAAFFGADTTEQIKETDIYATLDYLEQMGYDLKGFGFLTDYVTDISEVDSDDYDDSEGAHLDPDMGVIRNDNDNIIYAKSDYVFSYIASDNYVYTLANDNIATQDQADGWFAKLTTAIATAWYRIRNAVFGPVFDVLGVTNAVGERWGKGLITLYYEETPKNIGEKGTWVNQGSIWNWDNIKINMSNKTLSIARNEFLNTNEPIEFTLDGWSGRYGMPIEFLLSVHVATMMPDLPFDMIRNFPTRVNVYLHETSGDATAGYEIGSNQYVSYETLQTELSGLAGKNWFSSAINWFDNWFETTGEVEAARELGIDVGTGTGLCTCEFKEVEGTEIVSSACTYCKKKLEAMTEYLSDSNDYNFKAYTPYIANVENHWYRDVYFVSKVDGEKKPDGFVENDYDYEAITGERWTLYETDSNGEFILYEINEDGSYGNVYDGTAKEAQEAGIAVAKKAKLVKEEDGLYEDFGWEENGAGKWTAYGKEDTSSGYERLFTDEEVEEKTQDIGDETKKQAYKDALAKLYVNLNLTENVVQKGEGLRTETNPTIKKMFLQNQYFKYDGTVERAEVITALRKKGISYGALSDSDLDKSVTISNSDGNESTYKVSDVSGKVSLNQDALNAFSMLENTHTMDADFIYRDFKELIVELGYFEKEELTDETPRLLQWLVPEINSAGFPNKPIDKNENEFGTMVHSKGDIKANEKNTVLAKLKDFLANEAEHKQKDENISGMNPREENMAPVSSMNITTNLLLRDTVGALDGDVDPSSVSVQEFMEAAAEIHSRMEGNFWEYCAAGVHSGSSARHTSDGSCPGNYSTYEAANSGGKTADCSSYVSWVLQEVGVIKAKYNTTGMYTALAEYILTKEEAGELKEGDIVLTSSHVQINGANNLQYNAGSTNAIQNPPKEYVPEYTHVIRLPFNGSTSSKKGQYEGYKGNEAVVSPVTGILLDYGTYDGSNDKSSITDELYRQNVDLKYAKNVSEEDGGDGESPVLNPEYDPSKPDLVGYAKILVLDAENYKKLEAHTDTPWKNNSLVYTSKKTDNDGKEVQKVKYKDDASFESKDIKADEVLEDWTELQKTVYGYKEFAESYEYGGISGYVVYIDGFECYKPDENFTDEQLETESPSKDSELAITLDSFKKITSSNIEEPDENDVMKSLYEKDETHKMASKRATEKLKATTKVKDEANSTICLDVDGKPLIFIKEGTLIGRTITDYQLIEEYRGESYDQYRKSSETAEEPAEDSEESDENEDAVIGNYLRILFMDKDGANVEDVENYMKIDEPGSGKKLAGDTIEEKVWLALLDAGFSEIAAAGVMGNIYGESGFDPAAIEGGSGEGHGLCQWSFGRKEQLFAFAASRGVDWTDEDLQVEFLIAELTPGGGADGHASYQFSGYESEKEKWENASNVEDATTAFCAGFERPSVPRHQERIDAAQKYYEMYGS